MSERSSLTLTVDADLRRDFLTEADNAQCAASEILEDLMRDFVERQKEARTYDDFVRRKVETARASAAAGLGRPNEEVAAEFARRRAQILSSKKA